MKISGLIFCVILITACNDTAEKVHKTAGPAGETLTSIKADTQDAAFSTENIEKNTKKLQSQVVTPPLSPGEDPDNNKGTAITKTASSTPSITVDGGLPTPDPIKNNHSSTKTDPVNSKPASQPIPKPMPPGIDKKVPPSHEGWDKLLVQYVSDDKVNYKGLIGEKAALETYISLLEKNSVQENWSRNEKLAYWINAYNANTIKLIINNYPISSILKLDGGKPFDVKRILLGDKKYSLNDIENNILRPQFKDPRIHFAINCAAKSCPPLFNHAWTASNLEENLETQTKKFVNDARYNQIKPNSISISRIFDWYGTDFGNIVEFLSRYSNVSVNQRGKISFLEYNWDLNE